MQWLAQEERDQVVGMAVKSREKVKKDYREEQEQIKSQEETVGTKQRKDA